MSQQSIFFFNKPDMCMVCFKKPDEFALIKHHISYFPERIGYVHYECHKKIHDTPLFTFIQYIDGDSRKFYELKNKVKKNG